MKSRSNSMSIGGGSGIHQPLFKDAICFLAGSTADAVKVADQLLQEGAHVVNDWDLFLKQAAEKDAAVKASGSSSDRPRFYCFASDNSHEDMLKIYAHGKFSVIKPEWIRSCIEKGALQHKSLGACILPPPLEFLYNERLTTLPQGAVKVLQPPEPTEREQEQQYEQDKQPKKSLVAEAAKKKKKKKKSKKRRVEQAEEGGEEENVEQEPATESKKEKKKRTNASTKEHDTATTTTTAAAAAAATTTTTKRQKHDNEGEAEGGLYALIMKRIQKQAKTAATTTAKVSTKTAKKSSSRDNNSVEPIMSPIIFKPKTISKTTARASAGAG